MKNISSVKQIISIDRGNTKTSYALHEIDQPISKMISIDEAMLLSENSLVIAANVTNDNEYGISIDLLANSLFFNHQFCGMPVHYEQTLGIDRLLTAYLVWTFHHENIFSINEQNSKSLVIDVGTFTTCDFVSKNGFEGGFIMPGPFTLMESYTKGAKLKNLPPNFISSAVLPQSTDDAISYGGGMMLKGAIKEIIEQCTCEYIYLTGGASAIIREVLPNEKTRENRMLLHRALYQVAKKQFKNLV